MVRRARRAIRGVSPVLATLILIVVAVIAGLIVYGWVTGWIGGKLPTEEVRIDRIYLVDKSTLRLIVTNTGRVTVTIDYVWVVNATTGKTLSYDLTGSPVSLDPGETKSIELTSGSPHNLSEGGTVIVRVRTTAGHLFEATLIVEAAPS